MDISLCTCAQRAWGAISALSADLTVEKEDRCGWRWRRHTAEQPGRRVARLEWWQAFPRAWLSHQAYLTLPKLRHRIGNVSFCSLTLQRKVVLCSSPGGSWPERPREGLFNSALCPTDEESNLILASLSKAFQTENADWGTRDGRAGTRNLGETAVLPPSEAALDVECKSGWGQQQNYSSWRSNVLQCGGHCLR